MKITINGTRYDLSTMIDLGIETRENGGVKTKAVFFGPKSHRLIIKHYSIWESSRHDGTCVGTTYMVSEPGDNDWADRMQWAYDYCESQHEDMLQAAMDAHCPAEVE